MPLYKSAQTLDPDLCQYFTFPSVSQFPIPGEDKSIYTDTSIGKTYRWDTTNSTYVTIAPRDETYYFEPFANQKYVDSPATPLYLSKDDVNYKRIIVRINRNRLDTQEFFEVHFPIPVFTSSANTDLDGRKFSILLTIYPSSTGVTPNVRFIAGTQAGPCPGGNCPRTIFSINSVSSAPGEKTVELWFGCNLFSWGLIEPTSGTLSLGPDRCSYLETLESTATSATNPPDNSWEVSWNASMGRVGFVQMFAIPLTYNPPAPPYYDPEQDDIIYPGPTYTDPGYIISRELPTIDGFLDNPAHPITVPNFSFSSVQKPFFIGDWGFMQGGRAVNFPGYPHTSTKCAFTESRVRLGALSQTSNSIGVLDSAYFRILTDVNFILSVVVDGVGDSQYVPDRIVVATKEGEAARTIDHVALGFEANGLSKAKSPQINKNAKIKCVRFNVFANAGSTLFVQLINNVPTNQSSPSNLTRVMATSMFLFDQL